MALLDSLPDRPLRDDEAEHLRSQNESTIMPASISADGEVYTMAVTIDSGTYALGYSADEGGLITVDTFPVLEDENSIEPFSAALDALDEWAAEEYPNPHSGRPELCGS